MAAGCKRLTLIGTRCAGVSREPLERRRWWTSVIDAVEEEELADAFSIAHEAAGSCRGRFQGQKLVWRACRSPWCDKFPRGSYEMQSRRRKSRVCKHIITARQRHDELLLGDGHIDHTRILGLVHEGQTGTQAGRCSHEPRAMRTTTNLLDIANSQPG